MRLTSREYGETCLINEKRIIPCGSVCDEHDNCTTCPLQKAINKLADYEDLEEQCIAENQCGLRELLVKWKEFFDDIVELYDYRKAEEQGLLLRLPCKVGTPVYMIEQDCGGDTLDCRRGGCEDCGYLYRFIEENAFYPYMYDEIGKTIFLTREEAEAALAEKGGAE